MAIIVKLITSHWTRISLQLITNTFKAWTERKVIVINVIAIDINHF